MYHKTLSLLFMLVSCMALAPAEEAESVKIKPSGFAYYQIGQLMHVTPDDDQIEKPWDQHFNGRLTLTAQIKEQLHVIVGAEMELGVNINDNAKKQSSLLKEAQGIYSFGQPDNSYLQLAAGLFPFKYSPAQNLGEYLFRSGSYPGFIISDFDFAKIRLMGFRVSSNLFDKLQLHALFSSEYNVQPFFDYSLSFLAAFKPLESGILELGAGMMFDRLIPIIPSKTTSSTNIVRDENNETVWIKKPVMGKDRYGIDSMITPGEPELYTLKGIKLMGRITLDPKPLLPFADMLGENDAELYGEIALLGVKNYGAYYPDRKKRMPIMFGFNLPCFKLLDVASVEFEHYGSDSALNLNIPGGGSPLPKPYVGKARTNWKWSVYLKKTIVQGVALKGLVGRDHFRSVDPGGNYDKIERMNAPKDWHYKLRIMFSI